MKTGQVQLKIPKFHQISFETETARKKAKNVIDKLTAMKLQKTAINIEKGFAETLSYYDFRSHHWQFSRQAISNHARERPAAIHRGQKVGKDKIYEDGF